MRRQTLAALAVATAALTAPAAAPAADAIYGVTDQNRLFRFTNEAPGAATDPIAIQGLNAGETIVGLDVRPSDDTLFGVTSANRAVQINPVTGVTRPAFGPFDPALTGQSFGADFNPTSSALRLTSDTEQNLRVSSANVTTNDTALAYAAGDPGAGTNPSVGAVAYTNSVPNAESTTLFGIDTARDALVRIDPPNAGTLTTVGALGADYGEPAGFDIAPTENRAYAALQAAGQDTVGLFSINTTTGAATPSVAERNGILIPANAGRLRDIAVAGPVPDDNTAPTLSVAFSSTILEANTNPLRPSVSCDETCTVIVSAQVEGRQAGTGTATITGPGRATVEVPLRTSARARIARKGTELITLRISATDAAGNTRTQSGRQSRTQTLAARRGS